MINNIKSGKIKIDDFDISYISFGNGKKILIIIPGLGFKIIRGMAILFYLMYKELACNYKVYLIGRRNITPDGYTTRDMANDVLFCMDHFKIDKADVVGISQGGMIAQHLVLENQERINKLVLVVTIARYDDIMKESIENWISLIQEKKYKEMRLDSIEKSFSEDSVKKTKLAYKILGIIERNPGYDSYVNDAKACVTHNTFDDINKIKVPTLIIGSKKDRVLGYKGSIDLAEKIKGSELYIYDGYSHGVFIEAKDFNKRVIDFLKD